MKTKITLLTACLLFVIKASFSQWVQEQPGINESFRIDCLNGTNLCYIEGQNTLMKTTDLDSWTEVDINSVTGQISFLKVFSADTIYCVKGNTLCRTVDGGQNWSETILSTAGGVGSFYVNTNIGYSQGAQGEIYKTTDKGDTWTWLNTVPNEVDAISSIFFEDEMNGFIATIETNPDEINIYKTTDGAQNWTSVYTNTSIGLSLRDLRMISSQVGYVCGFNGMILKTTDSGNTWNELVNPFQGNDTCDYLALDFINTSNGYVVGTNNHIVKTTDGGQNWLDESYTIGTMPMEDVEIINLDTTIVTTGSSNWLIKNFDTNMTASINNLENEVIGKVYPNPSSDKLTFELNSLIGSVDLEIRDLNGKIVLQKILQGNKSEIFKSELNDGIYFYSILLNQKIIATGKVVFN